MNFIKIMLKPDTKYYLTWDSIYIKRKTTWVEVGTVFTFGGWERIMPARGGMRAFWDSVSGDAPLFDQVLVPWVGPLMKMEPGVHHDLYALLHVLYTSIK